MALQGCAGVPDSSRLLPEEIQGWKGAEPDGLYNAETLFDYIDGGAEVYRALNVKEIRARRYVKEGAPEIVADLFDMGSSSDAFGAYHHDLREGGSAGIGRESEAGEGQIAFWKGLYFVSITCPDVTEEARGAMLDLGRRIAAAIGDEGSPPALRGYLPGKDLREEQVHYFHTQASLNIYYRLAEGNPLGLHAGTEGILARYGPSGGEEGGAGAATVLLVRYPTEGEASGALRRFREAYLPASDAQGIARTLQGRWLGARAAGDLLVVVLDASSREVVESCTSEILRRRAGGE